MTSNSPLKRSPDGDGDKTGGSDTTVKDTRDFMKNLDQELKQFNDQIDSAKGSQASGPPAPQESPHFTIDTSPTRNMSDDR